MNRMLPCPVVHFEWTIEVLVGYHLMEPFLGVMMDQQPRPHHLALCRQMMEPLPGLWFHSIERHAPPALVDGFIGEYKKEWLESFSKHFSDMIYGIKTTVKRKQQALLVRHT